MQEIFDRSERISAETLKQLNRRSNGLSLLRFLIQYVLFWAAVLGLLFASNPWLSWLSFGIVALSVMPFFALAHEASHMTAFASRFLNQAVAWLVGPPIFYTPTGFRQFHWAHHRYTHDPERDPEVSLGGKPAPAILSRFPLYIGFISGLPLMFYKIALLIAASLGGPAAIWQGFLFFVSEDAKRSLVWEARFVLLFHIAWITAGLLWWPALLWIALALALGHGLLSLCLVSEHNGRPHTGEIFDRTRTTLTNTLIKSLMWNMPYHAEHHAYPSVPWHALPQLHALLKDDLKNVSPGYPTFHSKVFQSLLRGEAYQEKISSDQVHK